MPKRNFDEVDVVGGSYLSEKRTLAWKICNFADLEYKRGERVKKIGRLPCHGRSWSLRLYPRGDNKSPEEDEYVSAYLKLRSGKAVKANFTIRVGNHSRRKDPKKGRMFHPGTNETAWGWNDFCKRDSLLTMLDDGNLLVEVDIEVFLDRTQHVWPRGTLSMDMLKLLDSGTKSDVSFLVGGKRFLAHSTILAIRAPILAELAEDSNNGKSEILLEGVEDAEIFAALLRNVYGEETPKAELLEGRARDLLQMADRFGCTSLKLLAEAKLVESGINAETAADLLLLADAKNCASLQEAVLTFIKANTASVMKSPDWAKVEESAALLSEFMKTAFSESSSPADADGEGDLDSMTVATLRRELQKKRLSEDGTREMLVKRLKENSA